MEVVTGASGWVDSGSGAEVESKLMTTEEARWQSDGILGQSDGTGEQADDTGVYRSAL